MEARGSGTVEKLLPWKVSVRQDMKPNDGASSLSQVGSDIQRHHVRRGISDFVFYLVCVLLGMDVPVLLRPVKGRREPFMLVGIGYMHGTKLYSGSQMRPANWKHSTLVDHCRKYTWLMGCTFVSIMKQKGRSDKDGRGNVLTLHICLGNSNIVIPPPSHS